MNRFLYLCKCLGFAIPYDFKNCRSVNIKNCYHYYTYLIMVTLIVIYIYSTINIAYNVMPVMTILQILTESAAYLFITILDVYAILITRIKRKKWMKLFNHFKQIDKLNARTLSERNCQKTMDIQIIIFHILYSLLEISNVFFWIYKYGFGYYRNYLFEVFIKYYEMIITILICNFTVSIKHRFEYYNFKLNEARIYKNLDIPTTKHLFKHLNMLIETYNDLFGFEILIILSISVVAMLDLLSYVLDAQYTVIDILLDFTYFLDTILLLVSLIPFISLFRCNI